MRRFSKTEPERALIARLICAAYGKPSEGAREIPSAGGLYGLQFFVMQLADGYIWTVGPEGIPVALERSHQGNVKQSIFCQIEGHALIIWLCAASEVYIARYGTRGYRYMLIEAGHCAQEITRNAQIEGVRSCALGAFDDQAVIEIIGAQLTGLMPLYAIAVGFAEDRVS